MEGVVCVHIHGPDGDLLAKGQSGECEGCIVTVTYSFTGVVSLYDMRKCIWASAVGDRAELHISPSSLACFPPPSAAVLF